MNQYGPAEKKPKFMLKINITKLFRLIKEIKRRLKK